MIGKNPLSQISRDGPYSAIESCENQRTESEALIFNRILSFRCQIYRIGMEAQIVVLHRAEH